MAYSGIHRSAEQKLARYSKIEDGHLIWTGGVSKTTGYGVIWLDGKSYGAHCVSYCVANNIDIKNLEENVLHKPPCNIRNCIEPTHLYLGNQAQNMKDRTDIENNVNKTHCPQGHPYNDINTYLHKGRRHCKECRRENVRRSRKRVKESFNKFYKESGYEDQVLN